MTNHRPPNDPEKIPAKPFESENVSAEEAARVLKAQRKASGDLPDQPADLPVTNDKPFKLRSS